MIPETMSYGGHENATLFQRKTLQDSINALAQFGESEIDPQTNTIVKIYSATFPSSFQAELPEDVIRDMSSLIGRPEVTYAISVCGYDKVATERPLPDVALPESVSLSCHMKTDCNIITYELGQPNIHNPSGIERTLGRVRDFDEYVVTSRDEVGLKEASELIAMLRRIAFRPFGM